MSDVIPPPTDPSAPGAESTSTPPPPPLTAVPLEPAPSLPPPSAIDASASLKPLLNPLQTEDTPPQSTSVEPPRSPNPLNEAVDDTGRNMDLPPSAPGSITSAVEPSATDTGVSGQSIIGANGVSEDRGVNGSNGGIDVDIVNNDDLPPLPRDAPVPPSPPPPADEPVPELPPGAIPPAVSTPTVITTEDDAMLGDAPIGDRVEPTPSPAAQNSPMPPPSADALAGSSGIAAPQLSTEISAPPVPSSTSDAAQPLTSAGQTSESGGNLAAPSGEVSNIVSAAPHQSQEPQGDDAMDVDQDASGEDVEEPSAVPSTSASANLQNGVSNGSLKRPGEDLAGPEEKRIKEDGLQSSAPAAASSQSVQPEAISSQPAPAALPVGFVPINYQPPPPRNAGPTTPLTVNQHKHLLGVVRSLKKSKDSFPFLAPVDPVALNIPHYPNVVKHPMDLGTVETKLIVSNPRGPPKDKSKLGNWDESKGKYGSVSEVVNDVRQIWENTRMFNGPDHSVTAMADKLDASFEKGFQNIPAEAPSARNSPVPPPPPPPVVAGPSTTHARRPSISHPPAPRRSSDAVDRPKREIHPPPSKELPYAADQARKTKRRNDPQISYLNKNIKLFETKSFDLINPFLFPVDQIILELPEYANVIKRPIDLLQIKERLNDGAYDDAQQVNSDFKTMLNNAIKFNPPGHAVHAAAQSLMSLWDEKWKSLPSKEEKREISEDPIAEDIVPSPQEVDDDFEDDPTIKMLREQIQDLEKKIERLKDEKRKSKPSKPKKTKPATGASRKQSVSQNKLSPAANGHSHTQANPKKPRKSKDRSYDDGLDSEEEVVNISMIQKQELADRITAVSPEVLGEAIQIIQRSTDVGAGASDEIELDIESLPQRTVVQLYNLVCRGKRPGQKGAARKPIKSSSSHNHGLSQSHGHGHSQSALPGGGRKGGNKKGKRMTDENAEAARIANLEARLQSFDGRDNDRKMGAAGGGGWDDSDSSEEEESEEE